LVRVLKYAFVIQFTITFGILHVVAIEYVEAFLTIFCKIKC